MQVKMVKLFKPLLFVYAVFDYYTIIYASYRPGIFLLKYRDFMLS
jgi:hypothetical protein